MAEHLTISNFPGSIVCWQDQIASWPVDTPYTFINTVVVPTAEDVDAFLKAWADVAGIMKGQSGFLSAQLYRGCPDKNGRNNILVLVAVWESVAAYQAAGQRPELQEAIVKFPKGTVEHFLMATKVAVPGLCTASE